MNNQYLLIPLFFAFVILGLAADYLYDIFLTVKK